VWGPPKPNGVIGDIEQIVVAYCTTPGRGTRLMPEGTLKSAHFLRTPDYVQVTGVGDFTRIGIKKGDSGGELDPHGADKLGNPHGGLVFSNAFSAGPSGLGVQVRSCMVRPQIGALTNILPRCTNGPTSKAQPSFAFALARMDLMLGNVASISMVRHPNICIAVRSPSSIDIMGCLWNIPGQYGDGFTNCEGDSTMYVLA
jgi:hypothetical protein